MNNIINTLKKRIKQLFSSPSARRHQLVGPSHLWKMKREFQINFLMRNGLHPNSYLMDFGCGTLRGGAPIIKYLNNNRYFGLDSRINVIEEAKKEIEKEGLSGKEPSLTYSENPDNLSINIKFDIIWSFSVFIHLSNDILDNVLGFFSRNLKQEGVIYANVNISEKADSNWQGFPLVFRNFEFYEELCTKNGLACHQLGDLKSLGHHSGAKNQDNQIMLKIAKIKHD